VIARHQIGRRIPATVAAEARDEIGLPHLRAQPRRDAGQHRVTSIVAEAVIDLLEAVAVEI